MLYHRVIIVVVVVVAAVVLVTLTCIDLPQGDRPAVSELSEPLSVAVTAVVHTVGLVQPSHQVVTNKDRRKFLCRNI